MLFSGSARHEPRPTAISSNLSWILLHLHLLFLIKFESDTKSTFSNGHIYQRQGKRNIWAIFFITQWQKPWPAKPNSTNSRKLIVQAVQTLQGNHQKAAEKKRWESKGGGRTAQNEKQNYQSKYAESELVKNMLLAYLSDGGRRKYCGISSLPMVGSEGIVVLFAFGPIAKPVADCCHSGVTNRLLLWGIITGQLCSSILNSGERRD